MALNDFAYSEVIRKSNYRPIEAWEPILKGGIQADLVAQGSSRTWVQISPAILDSILCINSFNLGIDGSAINRQVQKYNIYRKRNSKPKVIIQNIDAWSLGYSIGYEKEQFFPFFWDYDVRKTFFSTEPFSRKEKTIPFFRYHGMNPKMFLHRFPRTLSKGYLGMNREWNGEEYMKIDSINFKVNDTTLALFDNYLNNTTSEGTKVVFVYAPVYFGATNKMSNADEMHTVYKNLADKYDIPILDYSEMWICRDTAYFYNAMHLNKKGAEIYSDSLANGIKRLNLL